MTVFQKLVNMLKGLLVSRKFWSLVAALVAVAAGYFTGEVAIWQAVQAVVAALAVYTGSVALEDGLKNRG